MDGELFEATEELKRPKASKAKLGVVRVSYTAKTCLGGEQCQGPKASKCEAGATGQRCSKELGVGWDLRVSEWDQGSADTQECESCQLNDMNVVAENKEDLSFSPIVVWHEPKFMC